MLKKAISAILAVPLAVGFCTAGYRGREPAVDRITERCSYVYQTARRSGDPYVAKDLGKFRLSFYTPYEEGGKWGFQTATGVKSQHLKTCAVDPSVIPLGSVVRVTGNNGKTLTLKCVDIGGLVKGKTIDIFMDCSQKEGYAFMESFGEIHSVYLLEE